MWVSLSKTYERKSIMHQIFLRKQLLNMRLNENQSLTDHSNKFEIIINELRSIGVKFEEIDAIIYLLVTLPSEYNSTVAALGQC